MSPHLSFSVVIPTFNRPDVLERTIRCFDAQNYPSELIEIIAVDNSSNNVPEVVEALAKECRCSVRVIRGNERLPAVKRNTGVFEAKGDIILFFNDDVWPNPDLIAEHARTHEAWDEPVAVLGRVEQSPEMEQTPFTEYYQPFAYYQIEQKADQPVSYYYSWMMNLSLPKSEMIERNLLVHEDWAEIGSEDVELGYRWTQAGRKLIYNPRAWGEHYHPHTLASACRLQESIGRGIRDLEWLVPDPGLLERYGIFSWRNSPRAIVRGLVRQLLFNKFTIPLAMQWLNTLERNNILSRWMYWKILLHYTNKGYREAPQRRPISRQTLPIASESRSLDASSGQIIQKLSDTQAVNS